jgi:hypothetical protein
LYPEALSEKIIPETCREEITKMKLKNLEVRDKQAD